MIEVKNLLTTVVISKNDLFGIELTLKSFSNLNGNFPSLILVLSSYSTAEIEGIKTEYNYLQPEICLIDPIGPYSAMNYGLEKTKTNFVNFLHGGDSYAEGSAILDLLQSMGDNLIGFGEMDIISSANTKIKTYSFKKYSTLLHRLGLKYIPHPATIVSTKAARDMGGFDLNYSVAADQKMLLQLAREKRPVVLLEIISAFQLGGLSTRSQKEIISDFRKISFDIYGYFWGNKIIDKFIWKINQFVRNLYSFILKHYK